MSSKKLDATKVPGEGQKPHLTLVENPKSHSTDQLPKLLLVDDSHENLFVLSSMLKKSPIAVVTALNGQEAIERFIADHFDIILMDIQMPIKDGFTAIKEIRDWEKTHGVPPTTIIAITANAMIEDRQRCLDSGATDYLSKPVKKNDLVMMIDKYLQRDTKRAQDF